MVHLLLGEELRLGRQGGDASCRLGLPQRGKGTAQQWGGELLLPQGRLLREQALVPDQQPQDALLRPGGADVVVSQLPLLGLELDRRVQVPPQLLPLLPGEAAFEGPLDLQPHGLRRDLGGLCGPGGVDLPLYRIGKGG